MDAHVVCPNCKMDHEISYDKKTDSQNLVLYVLDVRLK